MSVKQFLTIVCIMAVAIVLSYMEGKKDSQLEIRISYSKGQLDMQNEIEERAEPYYYKKSITPKELEIIIFGESQE